MLFMLLPPDGTTIDFNLQRAQAREDHAHAPVYVDMVGSAASAPHQWTSMLATLIDCDITHMDMLCAQGCTRRTLQGEPWMDAPMLLLSLHHARPFHFHVLDQGNTRATPKIVPFLLIQHKRVTMTSDPTTPLALLKRSACRRACAASETRYSMK